jgi:hypothetical protein
MFTRNKIVAGAALSLATVVANAGTTAVSASTLRGSADTLTLQFESIAGGGNAGRVDVGGSNLQAGHIVHTVLSGPGAGSSFSTFCVELGQNVGSGVVVYNIVSLTDAPLPGPSYSQSVANAVSAVVANARALGWIDGRLQADSSQSDYLGRMGAIQAAIWVAIGGDVDINSSGTSDFVRDAYAVLMNAQTFDSSLRMSGLRALTSASHQDMLYVVPLPPAVFAGAGLLAVGFGVRAVRRR